MGNLYKAIDKAKAAGSAILPAAVLFSEIWTNQNIYYSVM